MCVCICFVTANLEFGNLEIIVCFERLKINMRISDQSILKDLQNDNDSKI